MNSRTQETLAFVVGVIVGGLLAILVWSLLATPAHAASRTVSVPCGQDVDAKVNADPSGTSTRFVLGADCVFTASATVQPKNGDEVACAIAPTYTLLRGSGDQGAYDPSPRCTIRGSSTLDTVMKPQGTVNLIGFYCEGGDFKGSAGTGVCIAQGAQTAQSVMEGVHVRNNEGAGISSANGVHRRIELSNTTTNSAALGYIGSGMKGVNEFNIEQSFVHDNQGNGVWCDVHCKNVSGAIFDRYHAKYNLVVNNGRAGIRYERVGATSCGSDCDPNAGQALIENNWLHGNGWDAVRGGVSIRDAQNATVRNNVFGASSPYPHNVNNTAIRADDSGRSDRPDLKNIVITGNKLGGEVIKFCGGPVTCTNNTN